MNVETGITFKISGRRVAYIDTVIFSMAQVKIVKNSQKSELNDFLFKTLHLLSNRLNCNLNTSVGILLNHSRYISRLAARHLFD